VLGGIFLLQWLQGALPGAFAVPAGVGDVLVGLLALPVAVYAASGRRGSTAAVVAWNVLGIADLVNALTLGFLSTPGPFQLLAHDHPNLLVGTYPTALIPAFAVPLSLILHGVSLWQLRRRSRSRALEGGTGLRLGQAVLELERLRENQHAAVRVDDPRMPFDTDALPGLVVPLEAYGYTGVHSAATPLLMVPRTNALGFTQLYRHFRLYSPC